MSRTVPLLLAVLVSLAAHGLLVLYPWPSLPHRAGGVWHVTSVPVEAGAQGRMAVGAGLPESSGHSAAKSPDVIQTRNASRQVPVHRPQPGGPESVPVQPPVQTLDVPVSARPEAAVVKTEATDGPPSDASPKMQPDIPAAPGAQTPPMFQTGTLANPKPDYPGLSQQLGESGVVILRVYVDMAGHPQDVQVLQSSGFRRLDMAATRKVSREWIFRPARHGETPVADWVQVPLEFRLASVVRAPASPTAD